MEAIVLTEQMYNALWDFTNNHKDYHGTRGEPQTIAILSLYQENAEAHLKLKLKTAFDIEEACHCIRMALAYAF